MESARPGSAISPSSLFFSAETRLSAAPESATGALDYTQLASPSYPWLEDPAFAAADLYPVQVNVPTPRNPAMVTVTTMSNYALYSPSFARVEPGTLGALLLPASRKGKGIDWSNPGIAGYQDPKAQTPPAPANTEPTTRALPSPIDNPPFPITDWVVNNGFPIGENWDVAPGALQHALFGKSLDNTHYRLTGWFDAGETLSSSTNSNLPYTYNLVPNHPEIDQLVIEFQKMPDTVQKRYVDWGFLSAHLAGIDYRFTSAKGWLDGQLLTHNNLYGYDPVLQYFLVYFPKISDGAVLQIGRYISPIDIEAQLSNSNYLYSHSLMFGVDPYTYTGINLQVRVNKEFMYCIGVHAGNENSPWSGAAQANGEFLIGWNSADNKDSLWGGLDSIGSGRTIKYHDNEQICNFTWGHKWNDRLHMQTQAYYMWEYGATKGGTPTYGPTYPYASGGGPGPVIPGKSNAYGFVNNLEYKVNKKDYISFRNGFLNDPQGWRTGYTTQYSDTTLGYSHLFTPAIWVRPEIRYEHAYDQAAFDNGTRKEQFTAAADVIFRF